MKTNYSLKQSLKQPLRQYEGAWALVTGASSGIGEEFCRQLAQEKINIILVARRTQKMELLAKQLKSSFKISTIVITKNLSEKNSAAELKQQIEAQKIKVQILINNAGFGACGDFDKASALHYEDMIQVLLGTPVALVREFLNHFQSFSHSVVINVSSPAALQPIPYFAVYAAAKSGIHHFSLALYEEYRKKGIYFQTLIPGPTKSEFDALAEVNTSQFSTERDSAARVVQTSLLGITTKKAVITTAKKIYLQKFFNGVFPDTFILKKIGKLFCTSTPSIDRSTKTGNL